MRRFSNLSADERGKIPYLDIIAVGIIQFLLSIPLLCYGVLLMQFILEDFFTIKTGLWTVIIFVAIFKITNPWAKSYCKHLDNIKRKIHKRVIIIATFLLFGELVIVSLINTPLIQIIVYGALGGLLSTVIHVHVQFATSDILKTRPQLFDTLNQIMKSLCLIAMPHLVLFLTNEYYTNISQLIIGGLVLNIIPASLLMTTTKYQKNPLCKFQTVDRLSIEMVDITPKFPISDSSSSSSEDEEDELELNINKPIRTDLSTNVQIYFQHVGVNILPNIPEENECEDEDDINEISSKRLSKISAILQELNETTNKDITMSINNLYQPDEVENLETNDDRIVDFVEETRPKKSRCFSTNSSTIFAFQLKKQRIKNFLIEHFVKSFPRTLSNACFYPALISNGVITSLSSIILTASPYMLVIKNQTKEMTTEATFLLTIIGFTWIFFLAGYPVFSKISSLKIKVLFLIGLSMSGLSLFVAQNFSYDNFTLFSLTFGLGHGMVTYTENIACQDFFGKQSWKKLQGALEISTGFIVILIYFVIYCSSLEISELLRYAYWPYVFNVSLWIIAFILKRIVFQVKKISRYHRSSFNFPC